MEQRPRGEDCDTGHQQVTEMGTFLVIETNAAAVSAGPQQASAGALVEGAHENVPFTHVVDQPLRTQAMRSGRSGC